MLGKDVRRLDKDNKIEVPASMRRVMEAEAGDYLMFVSCGNSVVMSKCAMQPAMTVSGQFWDPSDTYAYAA